MDDLLVSVVMPSLNQSQFLEIAVRSVLEQDHQNIELIIVDGMSTDGTLQLLTKLSHEYIGKIHWISQKDTGPAEALNTAISMAHGNLIGWLNSDDMFLQGAISSAVNYFHKNPTCKFLYGNGACINADGTVLHDYPTLPPSSGIANFKNGNFICQPSVFFQKEALIEVGGFDSSIKTAFDFDLFIRFFKTFPKNIGYINRVQAYSRIHSNSITSLMRRKVAVEGMSVLSKHFGHSPEHWFWTHIDEICDVYPLHNDANSLVKQVSLFLSEIKTYLIPDVLIDIISRLKSDHRLKISKDNLYATVQPDGWVSNRFFVKYRWINRPSKSVLVYCNANWPIKKDFSIKIYLQTGYVENIRINVPSKFIINLEVPNQNKSGFIIWMIEIDDFFIPSEFDKKSLDNRKLCLRVNNLLTEN